LGESGRGGNSVKGKGPGQGLAIIVPAEEVVVC